MLANSGVIPPPARFLQGLHELCDDTGAVLVFDEVITGFRIDHGGAVTRYGRVPDLIMLAKAIAGGYPLAAVAGKGEIIDRTMSGIVHAGTYNGNPVVLAAAAATLDARDQPGIYEDFERRGVFALPGGRWYISTAHTYADIAHTVSVIDESIAATVKGPDDRAAAAAGTRD